MLLIVLAIYQLRLGDSKTGYVVLTVGLIMLLSKHFGFIVAAILIGVGYYYYKAQPKEFDRSTLKRHNILESLKYNEKQWELRDTNIMALIGEVYMDLSLAMIEHKQTRVVVQGVIGDVDIIVPDDIGISIEASVLIGQIKIGHENEAGLLNKVVWQSGNYDSSEYKVHFAMSYLIGDINVRVL